MCAFCASAVSTEAVIRGASLSAVDRTEDLYWLTTNSFTQVRPLTYPYITTFTLASPPQIVPFSFLVNFRSSYILYFPRLFLDCNARSFLNPTPHHSHPR